MHFPLTGLDMTPYVLGPGVSSLAPSAGGGGGGGGGAHGDGGCDGSMAGANCSVDGRLVYDLYGVVNHYGGSNFGHYNAYCLSPVDSRWHLYDDSTVTAVPADPDRIVSSAAYLLFYRLRGATAPPRPASPGTD